MTIPEKAKAIRKDLHEFLGGLISKYKVLVMAHATNEGLYLDDKHFEGRFTLRIRPDREEMPEPDVVTNG